LLKFPRFNNIKQQRERHCWWKISTARQTLQSCLCSRLETLPTPVLAQHIRHRKSG